MEAKTKKSKAVFDYKSIKSFEDACKKVKVDPSKLPDVSMIPLPFRKAIINCYKLYIIYKAINDGWVPDWSNMSQWKYYPWFRMNSSGSGFDFSFSLYGCDYSLTCVGSRLCFPTSELAEYFGKQFIEIHRELLTINK
jgi:hypothetical protein